MRTYTKLSHQASDEGAYVLDLQDQNLPVGFVNKLPIDITVIQEPIYQNVTREVGLLKALGVLELNYDQVEDGDLFHFLYKGRIVCPSHTVIKRLGNIMVGNVISSNKSFKRDVHPGGDVSSLNFHNMLRWPIVISIGDKPIAYIQQNIDLGTPKHHSDLTVSPSVYYDNNNQGVMLGTKFDVSIDNREIPDMFPLEKGIKLYSFVLNDTDSPHIFIGGVNSIVGTHTATGANSEINSITHTGRAIYRLGDPNVLPNNRSPSDTVKGHNHPGMDKFRGNTKVNVKRTPHSTVPLARYKQLSGANTVCGVNL